MKKKFLMYILILSAVICTWFVFSISVSAVNAAEVTPDSIQPDMTLTIEELNIVPDQAILVDQTKQMQIEDFAESVIWGSVEWSSSNSDVISCTNTGFIKGLKEGSATITVKAKVGDASDTIKVYCARKLNGTHSSRVAYPLAWSCKTPFFLNVQAVHINVFPLVMTEKLDVKGVYGSFFYVEFERNEKQYAGFIPQNWMPSGIASGEIFRQLSTYNLEVFVGKEDESNVVTTNYKGSVNWKVSPENIIDFNDKTGKVTGKSGGVAVISATVGTKTLKCTVHSIYVWPLEWTGAARQETCVYRADRSTYEPTSTKLAVGDEFTVIGDMGGDSYWVYGVSENGTEGYIPISHISTKGTISQYSNLKTMVNGEKVPVVWPMYATTIKNISSPYGPRNITASGSIHHRGFDITTGKPGEIAGEYVVAAFSGIVTKIHTNTSDCGFCISISTDCVDPITNKNISIIYMHLLETPKYSNGINIILGDHIEAGTIIGKVGKSNGNTDPDMGYHLHFEANSQNASVGDPGRSDFTYTLNPMYFFVNKSVTFSGTNSYNKYGGYWYDLTGGYQNEEIFKSYFNF